MCKTDFLLVVYCVLSKWKFVNKKVTPRKSHGKVREMFKLYQYIEFVLSIKVLHSIVSPI